MIALFVVGLAIGTVPGFFLGALFVGGIFRPRPLAVADISEAQRRAARLS